MTTAGEALGFVVPAVVAGMFARSDSAGSSLALIAAGTVEGAILGAIQSVVLRRAVPAASSRLWILATACGAGFAWFVGLLPRSLHAWLGGWSPILIALLALVAGSTMLVSIGFAQWLVLRRHVARSAGWIAATAAGWCVGLVLFMAVAMPLWQVGQSAIAIGLIGAFAALFRAASVGVITACRLPVVSGTSALSSPA